jgi:GNAT superfamily N-acetyltransferase
MPHSIALMREIAPLALSRRTQKELGCSVWSDADHVWFVAYDKDNDINPVGMCATIGKGSYYQCCHDFVMPIYRGEGVYKMLFEKRFNWMAGFPAKATCTHRSLSTYKHYGFKAVRETKNYTFVERF